MTNVKSTLRCRAQVYLSRHIKPTRCVGWRHHYGDHLARTKGGVLVKEEEVDVPLEITWPNLEKRGRS